MGNKDLEVFPGTAQTGVSKRELFAAMILQGFCSNYDYLHLLDKPGDEKVPPQARLAAGAVLYAEALIKELQK